MPIYNSPLAKAPWVVVKKMEKKRLKKYIDVFKDSMKSFPGRRDFTFLSSIDVNASLTKCYIAEYDIHKTAHAVGDYQNKLESLVREANNQLNKHSKLKDIKFDIIGNWTYGKVILIEKKETKKDEEGNA